MDALKIDVGCEGGISTSCPNDVGSGESGPLLDLHCKKVVFLLAMLETADSCHTMTLYGITHSHWRGQVCIGTRVMIWKYPDWLITTFFGRFCACDSVKLEFSSKLPVSLCRLYIPDISVFFSTASSLLGFINVVWLFHTSSNLSRPLCWKEKAQLSFPNFHRTIGEKALNSVGHRGWVVTLLPLYPQCP